MANETLQPRFVISWCVVDCWESDRYFSQSLCILTELLANYRWIAWYFGLFYQIFVYFNIHKVFPGQNSKNNLIGVHFSDFTWIFPWNERNQLENAFGNQLASRSWQKSRRVSVSLDFKPSFSVKICKCTAKTVDICVPILVILNSFWHIPYV